VFRGIGVDKELLELAPPGAAPAASAVESPAAQGDAIGAAPLQAAADMTLAGWKVITGVADTAGPLIKHLESENTFLAIATVDRPVVLAQQISIPADGQGRLRIKVGYVANEAWQLKVADGERTLLDTIVGGQSEPGWQRYELSFATPAPRTANIIVTASSLDTQPRKTLWSRLEVNR
jgi:hypothetical protein